MKQQKNAGKNIPAPQQTCTDKKCPFHGDLKLRGRTFKGTVTSAKGQNSSLVSWKNILFNRKYERYYYNSSKVAAHNPPCINAQEGELVKIHECKPLSKTKRFVIVEKLGKERAYELKKELQEEGKQKSAEKQTAPPTE